MDYDDLLTLKRDHPTWRLLNADSAPLIISFFHRVFIEPNRRSIAQAELVEYLQDYIFHLRQSYGEKLYPRPARAYLDDWASGEQAFLRKYYPSQGDEPEYDLTPATETVIEWLRSLRQRQFVGTESRLLSLFQLLQDIVDATEPDPTRRIEELEKQKAQLDAEINRLCDGKLDPYDPTQLKERYYNVEDTARRLLADFRQVEENFRQLDRQVREKIATTDTSKGALLDDIFGDHDAIADSDQGKSFRAFWALLMSPNRQQQLAAMAGDMLALPEVQSLEPDALLVRINDHLLEAGTKVQNTSAALVDQLRRFLDDQAWLENKRIMALIHKIEKQAVQLRQTAPKERQFLWLDDFKADLNLPLARPLFQPPRKPIIKAQALLDGEAEFSSDALYNIHYVDEAALRASIRRALQQRSQIALSEICQQQPLSKGLAELVTYLHIASDDSDDPKALIDDQQQHEVFWIDSGGETKKATLPAVIFMR